MRKGLRRWMLLLAVLAVAVLPPASALANHTQHSLVAIVDVPSDYWSQIAVNPTTHQVYITDNYAHTVRVVDGVTNSVVATINDTTKFMYPRGIAVNPDTNRIYVSAWVKIPGDYKAGLVVIDGLSDTIIDTVSLDIPNDYIPDNVAVNPSTNRVYAADWHSNSVSVVDGATNQRVAAVTGLTVSSYGEADIAVNPTTNRVYVLDTGGGRVGVIDGETYEVSSIELGGQPCGIAVNLVTNRVYVGNCYLVGAPGWVLDGNTHAVLADLPTLVGGFPGDWKHMAVNTAANRVYAGGLVLDGATLTVVDNFRESSTERWLAVDPGLGRIYQLALPDHLHVIGETPGFHLINVQYPVYITTSTVKMSPNHLPELDPVHVNYSTGWPRLGIAADVSAVAYNFEQHRPVARLSLRFSQVTENVDVSGLTVDVDPANGKSVIHRAGGFPAMIDRVDLYVPKRPGQNRVRVCPGATSLAEVAQGCTGEYTLVSGQAGLSTATVAGGEYWVVENISGTGAQAESVIVALSTDKAQYIEGETILLTAVVTDETGAAISGLTSSAFVTTLDGAPATAQFSETATPGVYTASLGIVGLAGYQYSVAVTVTDSRGTSGTGSDSFSIVTPTPTPTPTPRPVSSLPDPSTFLLTLSGAAAILGYAVLNRRWGKRG